jgi:hypothetical protein
MPAAVVLTSVIRVQVAGLWPCLPETASRAPSNGKRLVRLRVHDRFFPNSRELSANRARVFIDMDVRMHYHNCGLEIRKMLEHTGMRLRSSSRGRARVVAVMPAYNARRTLERTLADIPPDTVDDIILADDCSSDDTAEIARRLGLKVLRHDVNRGYGGNQKTCYDAALRASADIVVMVHPDYQYDPRVIPFAVGFIETGICDAIVASRIRTRRETLEGGMPLYKYLANRILTTLANTVFGQNLGDFHSGFRVYRRSVLETIDYHTNSDDFVFDFEFLAQAVYHNFRIGDIPIPTRYSAASSSINLQRSVTYGLGNLVVMAKYILQSAGLGRFRLFDARRSQRDASDLAEST